MKCEGFSQITDLTDYLDNNRLIAHYCGFDIMKSLPSYWTYDRFLKQLKNGESKSIMAQQVKKLYELGIVDASFIGLDPTPVAANTKQNNPKSFASDKFKPENQPKADRDCTLGVHSASNQHDERRYEFYWGYKNHVLVDCISGLPIFELTTPANIADSTMAIEILVAADAVISLKECSFLADKGYDAKEIYNTVRTLYNGEAFIPFNKRCTKSPISLPTAPPFAMPDWLCAEMESPLTGDVSARNIAVLFANPSLAFVPVAMKNGTTERRIRAVSNTKLFLPITVFLSTDPVYHSSAPMPCV